MVQELLDLSTGKVWRRTLPDGEWSTSLVDNGPYVRSRLDGARLITGTLVLQFSNSWATLFTESQYKALVGRWFSNSYDCITVMNGDVGAGSPRVAFTAEYDGTNKVIHVIAAGATINAGMRVNYAIHAGY